MTPAVVYLNTKSMQVFKLETWKMGQIKLFFCHWSSTVTQFGTFHGINSMLWQKFSLFQKLDQGWFGSSRSHWRWRNVWTHEEHQREWEIPEARKLRVIPQWQLWSSPRRTPTVRVVCGNRLHTWLTRRELHEADWLLKTPKKSFRKLLRSKYG